MLARQISAKLNNKALESKGCQFDRRAGRKFLRDDFFLKGCV